jgi:hypothetical protein
MDVVGGKIEKEVLDRDKRGGNESREEEKKIRVLILEKRGNLLIWNDNQNKKIKRCMF